MAGYKSVPKNNICAHLDLTTPNARHFTEIITFLRRSRIFTAISTIHVPYQSHQQDFWASADIDCEVEPPVIRGKVLGHDVVISAEHIRRVCGFQDSPDQPTPLDRYLVRGCFMRCKYEGDLGAGILNKAFMSPQFNTSVAEDDDVDIDSLLDLDFMATTTGSVSTPLEMAGTTSADDKEDLAESDDSGDEDGGDGAGDSDYEDTPDDEFESVWVGKRLMMNLQHSQPLGQTHVYLKKQDELPNSDQFVV
ncbi:hypothetical protein R6Q57_016015, partial [Mikania cordata]